MKQHRIQMILRATSPIAHHSETYGNMSLVSREKVRVTGGGFEAIPIISGNAMRNGLRTSAAKVYLSAAGLIDEPGLTQAALRLLLNGGVISGSSGGSVKLAEYAEIGELVPMLRLLGGCAQNRTHDGRAVVHPALLICDETIGRMPPMVSEYLEAAGEKTDSHRSHISEVQEVRMDSLLSGGARELLLPGERAEVEARMIASESASETGDAVRKEATKSTMLPMSYETVVRGSLWYWEQTFTTYSAIDEDTMWTMVLSFATNMNRGGRKRVGHGNLEVAYATEFELAKPADSVEFALSSKESMKGAIFRDHVQSRKERIREFLQRVAA